MTASTLPAVTRPCRSATVAVCKVMVSSGGRASMSARAAASSARAISRSTRSTARFMVLASPLNTRSTALFCTSGGRSTCLDAALYLIRHCVTASRSAGTAGPSSDSTRLTSETSLVETPINFAVSPWVIFRTCAEFSSGVRGLPGAEYWDMR